MYIWIDTIYRTGLDGDGPIVDGLEFSDELGVGIDKREYEGDFLQIFENEISKENFYFAGYDDMIHEIPTPSKPLP